jgi:hypothetical protein
MLFRHLEIFVVFLFSCAMRCLCAATPGAALVAEGWKHRVYLVYPPEEVKSDEGLGDTRGTDAVRLSAAEGEVEPFLSLLRPEIPIRGVEARLSALSGPEGAVIPSPALC